MKVFWSRCGTGEGNFGDRLTPFLLAHLGAKCEWSAPEHADVVGVGSVLERVPEDFKGTLWSTGFMYAGSQKTFSRADVMAVRGHLTHEQLQCSRKDGIVMGDGGLLSHLLLRPPAKKYKLGFVPHFVDAGDPVVAAIANGNPDFIVIDVCQSPVEVVRQIGECEHILSSSLHGLVVADSLKIPNHWIKLDRGAEVVSGAGFKFRDYYTAFNISDPQPFHPTASDNWNSLRHLFKDYARPNLERIQLALLRSLAGIVAKLPKASPAELRREVELKESWMAGLQPALRELATAICPDDLTILVDEDQLREHFATFQTLPFLERDGRYWGPPSDDATAIFELERLRLRGACYIAFTWPAFWWLEHYERFVGHLRSNFPCLLRNERLEIYDLR